MAIDPIPGETLDTTQNTEPSPQETSSPESSAKVRRSQSERLEALRLKQEQLKAQIAALEAQEKTAERKRDARRKIIVGGAVLAHAALHPAFAAELSQVLKVAVIRDRDKDMIRDLLEGPPSPANER